MFYPVEAYKLFICLAFPCVPFYSPFRRFKDLQGLQMYPVILQHNVNRFIYKFMLVKLKSEKMSNWSLVYLTNGLDKN